MARPPLELGTAGDIRYYYRIDGRWQSLKRSEPPAGVKPEQWRAVCWFRDYNGSNSQLERTSATKAKATAALRAHVAERTGLTKSGTLTATSRVKDAAKLYLDDVRRHRSATHVGRKTVGTVLAKAGHSSRQVADQLRQSSIQTTEKHYIERGILNPAAAKLIDAAHRPTTTAGRGDAPAPGAGA
jgi:integrase